MMTTNAQDDLLLNELEEIVEKIKTQRKNRSDHQIDQGLLKDVKNRLDKLYPKLLFQKEKARERGPFSRYVKYATATEECQNVLDEVNTAILRATVTGNDQDVLKQIDQVQREIDAAVKRNELVGTLIQFAEFMRKVIPILV